MNSETLLVIAPIAISIGNILLTLLMISRAASSRTKLAGLGLILIITVVTWFGFAFPYIMGLAGSAVSCHDQLTYPGCQRYIYVSDLFNQTLGNLNYPLLLCVLDGIIAFAYWYNNRIKGAAIQQNEG